MLVFPAVFAGLYPIDLRGLTSALEQSVKLYARTVPCRIFSGCEYREEASSGVAVADDHAYMIR